MNWQLLRNVNPPLNKLLVFYCPERNAVFFGCRNGSMLKLGNTYSDGIRDGWNVDMKTTNNSGGTKCTGRCLLNRRLKND